MIMRLWKFHKYFGLANLLLTHKCQSYINYTNDQLQFSLLKMGQVEILGRDRKRSKEKERGQERSISIGTNNMTTTVNKHNKIVLYVLNKTCILASTKHTQNNNTYVTST